MAGYSRGGRRSGSGSRLPSDDNTPSSGHQILDDFLREKVISYLQSKLFVIFNSYFYINI